MLTLHDEFKNKLLEITDLSNKINKNDNSKILEMMKEHVEEIEERYNNNDEHWTIETADEDTTDKSDTEIYCTACKRTVPDDAILCPYCGEKFDNSEAKLCPSCGVENSADGKFCEECGDKL